jgi:hypothetical protein
VLLGGKGRQARKEENRTEGKESEEKDGIGIGRCCGPWEGRGGKEEKRWFRLGEAVCCGEGRGGNRKGGEFGREGVRVAP